MKNYYTIAVIALAVLALVLGGVIVFQKYQSSQHAALLQSTWQGIAEDTSRIDVEETTVFAIFVTENTQLFGIAKEGPYYGEPPAPITGALIFGSSFTPFEIWGHVVSVDLNDNVIYISADYPRIIDTEFTPRGPRISLEDIKQGDRIVANGVYDENEIADYNNMEFIQITPSLEEIRRLREAQNQ